jgi:hypothetical protein
VLTLTVPAGALDAPVDISIQPITNVAPHGQGLAYRLGPAGLNFLTAVTLTFQDTLGLPVDALGTAYATGSFWLRPLVVPDAVALTLASTAQSFAATDWSLVTLGTDAANDLVGNFALSSSIGVPFTAAGSGVLTFAGSSSGVSYYFPSATATVVSPIVLPTTTCTPVEPPGATVPVSATSLAELQASPATFIWGLNVFWNANCADGSTVIADGAFDTYGINYPTCARSYAGTPLVSSSHLECDAANGCTYLIDCGMRGTFTATWNWALAGP